MKEALSTVATEVRSLRLKTKSVILTAFMTLMVILSGIAVSGTFFLSQQRRDLILSWSQLQNAADRYFTTITASSIAAQGYAATEQRDYGSDYQQEKQAHLKAEKQLREFTAIELNGVEKRILEQNIAASNNIQSINDRAVNLTSRGASGEALSLVYSGQYIASRTDRPPLSGPR